MIRLARFTDQPAIEKLLRRSHARSKYAGRVSISDKAMESVVTGMIASMTQPGPQGTHVAVAERDGKVVGFVAGVFDRVYHIGDKLVANDAYLVNEGKPGDTFGLIDSYIAWARGRRSCIEVKLSWTDALPGAWRIAELYKRKGGILVGEIYEIRLDFPAIEEAA